MRIANSKSGMRVMLNQLDLAELGVSVGDRLHMELMNRSVQNFLHLSATEFPHSKAVTVLNNMSGRDEPAMLLVNGKYWVKLKDLPLFGPEPVSYTSKEHAHGKLFAVSRPPMTRAAYGGKKPPVYKTKAQKQAEAEAANNTDKTKYNEWLQENANPVVAPPTVAEVIESKPALSQEDRALLDEAAIRVRLRAAIQTLNDYKTANPTSFNMSVKDDGLLTATMEL